MPTPTSATQLWKQEPQPALPPPTRPTNTDAQIFTPVAIETAGIWHHQAVELDQELGRRATIITGDSKETTTYLFQQLSVASQKGNVVSF